ncbi:MAG: ferritin-like domain-containing protein [Myxococcota bacterium]
MESVKGILDALEALVHLEIDAFHAYGQALKFVEVPPVREKLHRLQGEHERNATHLSEIITKLGGKPPPFSRDFKGFLLEGFTAIRSVTGTEGALQALRMNERLVGMMYERAMAMDLPKDVYDAVKHAQEDERKHLKYLEHAINTRVWEPGQPGAAAAR